MQAMTITITLQELSRATGHSSLWWRKHWLAMHQAHQFPRKLPGLWAWPRSAVEAWVRCEGEILPAPAAVHPTHFTPANENHAPEAGTALLDARYGDRT